MADDPDGRACGNPAAGLISPVKRFSPIYSVEQRNLRTHPAGPVELAGFSYPGHILWKNYGAYALLNHCRKVHGCMEEGNITISLDDAERARYARQLIYPDFGEAGQLCLKKAHVLIAGVGGLGSPNAVNLTCAGVGKLTLVDGDSVDISNLNRQTLHWEKDVGVPKVISGAVKLAAMNSRTEIVPLHVRITAENAAELLAGVDLVMDCLDNMEARFVLNAYCVRNNIPFIHGGIRGLDGEVITIIPGRTPCLECLYPKGIGGADNMPFPAFGATPALVASLQTMEAIKLLAGFGELLAGKMLFISGESMEFSLIETNRKKECRICGESIDEHQGDTASVPQ